MSFEENVENWVRNNASIIREVLQKLEKDESDQAQQEHLQRLQDAKDYVVANIEPQLNVDDDTKPYEERHTAIVSNFNTLKSPIAIIRTDIRNKTPSTIINGDDVTTIRRELLSVLIDRLEIEEQVFKMLRSKHAKGEI